MAPGVRAKMEAGSRRAFRAEITGWSTASLEKEADRYCELLAVCAPVRRNAYLARLRAIDHELVTREHGRRKIFLADRNTLHLLGVIPSVRPQDPERRE